VPEHGVLTRLENNRPKNNYQNPKKVDEQKSSGQWRSFTRTEENHGVYRSTALIAAPGKRSVQIIIKTIKRLASRKVPVHGVHLLEQRRIGVYRSTAFCHTPGK
jgi:hypothetical protein